MNRPQRLRGEIDEKNIRRRDIVEDYGNEEDDESDYSSDDDDDDDHDDIISQLSELSSDEDADASASISIPPSNSVKALTLDEISYDRGTGGKVGGIDKSWSKQALFDAGPPARKPRNRRPINPVVGDQAQDVDKDARRRRRKDRREKERVLSGDARDSSRRDRREKRITNESVNKDRSVKPLKIMSRQAASSGSLSLSGMSASQSINRDGFSNYNPSRDPLSEAISALSLDPSHSRANSEVLWDPYTGEAVGFTANPHSVQSNHSAFPSRDFAADGRNNRHSRSQQRASQRESRSDFAHAGHSNYNDGGLFLMQGLGHDVRHSQQDWGRGHGRGHGRSGMGRTFIAEEAHYYETSPVPADQLSRSQWRCQQWQPQYHTQQHQQQVDNYNQRDPRQQQWYELDEGRSVQNNNAFPRQSETHELQPSSVQNSTTLRPSAREWQPVYASDSASLRPTAKEFAPTFRTNTSASNAASEDRSGRAHDELSPAAPEYTPFGTSHSFFNRP